MITRKAINAAFEIITNDKAVKTVTMFCPNRPHVSTFKMERVRVTRIGKSKQSFAVTFGRINYAERQFVQKHISKNVVTPSYWIKGFAKKKKAK